MSVAAMGAKVGEKYTVSTSNLKLPQLPLDLVSQSSTFFPRMELDESYPGKKTTALRDARGHEFRSENLPRKSAKKLQTSTTRLSFHLQETL